MAVPITFSVFATPVRPEPSPKKLFAVTTPTFRTAVLLESAAPVAFVVPIPTLVVVLIPVSFAENLPPATPVSAEPSPIKLDAVTTPV